MSNVPFCPGLTATLAVSNTTGRVALAKPNGAQVHITTLAADAACYIKFGDVTVVATTSDMRINPGATHILTVPAAATHVAAITAASTAALSVTSGIGD